MNDEDRFIAETQEEAHYWFTVSDFAHIALSHDFSTMLNDVKDMISKLQEKKHEEHV